MVQPCPSYHAGLLLLQNLRPENPNQHLAHNAIAPFVAIYIYQYFSHLIPSDMLWHVLTPDQLCFFQAHHSTKGNPFCGNFWVRAPSPAHHGCAHPMWWRTSPAELGPPPSHQHPAFGTQQLVDPHWIDLIVHLPPVLINLYLSLIPILFRRGAKVHSLQRKLKYTWYIYIYYR